MSRYLRLYSHFVRFSLSQAMQFRFDFYFRIFMDCIFYVVNIYFYKIIFLHTNQIAGWTEPQVMIFIGGYLLVDAINMTLVASGTWMIPVLVNKGELDYYLLRPVSSLFFLMCKDFSISSSINLIIAAGILVHGFLHYPDPILWWRILIYLVLLVFGTYLFLLLRLILMLPVFWTHSGRGFETLFWTLNRFMERPDSIYTGWIRWILISVLPFIIMCSLPVRVLFEENILPTTLICIGVTAIFHFLTVFIWQKALRSYSSASS